MTIYSKTGRLVCSYVSPNFRKEYEVLFCYGTSFRVHSHKKDGGRHVFILEEVDSVFDKGPLAGVKVDE